MIEQLSHVLGWHTFDNRVDHQEQSIVLEPSRLWVFHSEGTAHPVNDEKEGLNLREGSQRF
jgi:hypothetical protein